MVPKKSPVQVSAWPLDSMVAAQASGDFHQWRKVLYRGVAENTKIHPALPDPFRGSYCGGPCDSHRRCEYG